MSADLREFPEVPTIGAAVKIHGWFPVVTVSCSCGHGEPFTIVGEMTVATCSACGADIAISLIQFSRAKQSLDLRVGRLVRHLAPPA